jgi:UDP-N-acetylmuramoylalanine--D-glutamate ligase
MNVHGKKIWVVGAARSGIAAARLLKYHGADIFVTDSNKIDAAQKKILEDLQIPFEENGHSIDRMLKDAELVVLSPSIPLDRSLPFAVKRAGIPIAGEIEVASWFLPKDSIVVGITGTNGKSTTTHYASQLFNRGGRKAVACGNIGLPLADTLLAPSGFDAFIVELSSYQLETTQNLRPDVSIFLNLQNDHLARYGTMEEYLKAKWRLVMMTKSDGLTVIEENVLRRAVAAGLPLPDCRIVALCAESSLQLQTEATSAAHVSTAPQCPSMLLRTLPRPAYGQLKLIPLQCLLPEADISALQITSGTGTAHPEQVHLFLGSLQSGVLEEKFTIKNPVLEGYHNQLNIAAAGIAARHAGITLKNVCEQWEAATSLYVHLPHRLEEVCKGAVLRNSRGDLKKIRAINDSKATNVESTVVAVKSFSKQVRLLLGGEPKGDLYSDLIPFLGSQICRIYPFGKAAPLICAQLSKAESYLAEPSVKMTDAAAKAFDDASDGDIVLLSPACASFDEFMNFEHRGDVFRSWVTERSKN